jgi:hypothetical protein
LKDDITKYKLTRRKFMATSFGLFSGSFLLNSSYISTRQKSIPANEILSYDIELATALKGYDGLTCWVHARAAALPSTHSNKCPSIILTMQKLLLSGSDVYYGISDMHTDDLGHSWSLPCRRPALARIVQNDGSEAIGHDYTPKWHKQTNTILCTGKVAWYKNEKHPESGRPGVTAYTVYDKTHLEWERWRILELPDEAKFLGGAGCTQRVDLPDGTILLPVYHPIGKRLFASAVVRCKFDGKKLEYLEHGNNLQIDIPRGFAEPSLTFFQNKFYITLRNDMRAYMASSIDGLHFEEPKPWKFEDGEELGSYNTQQHWVTHSDALFLVYTRKGADNDHVMRHRAPLFMAQVVPELGYVIRETEQIIVPERGARLGNFGVTEVNREQSWVVVTEWMQSKAPNPHDPSGASRYGSDNSVFISKINWSKPNDNVFNY